MTSIRLITEKVPLLALVFASCLVTLLAQSAGNALAPLESIPLEDRIGNAIVSYVVYIRKMFWPQDLGMMYPHMGMPPGWQIVASAFSLLAISYIAARYARSRPFLLVGWLWFLGTLVPVIGIVQVGPQAMADRYTYLPLIGLFIAVVWGLRSLIEALPVINVPVSVSSLVIIAVLMILSRTQVETWNNNFTLYEQALRVTQVNPLALNNLGAAYFEAGLKDEAVPYFKKALEIKSDFPDPWLNLGACAIREGNYDDAIYFIRQAVEISPRNTKIRMDLGIVMMETGLFSDAEKEFRYVLASYHEHETANHCMGVLLLRQGMLKEAEVYLRTAMRINSRNAEVCNNLGVALLKQGRHEDALASFKKALELEPGRRDMEKNMQAALSGRGN